LEASNLLSKTNANVPSRAVSAPFQRVPDSWLYSLYALALGTSISIWFLAIRAPLWLDETISYFIIKGPRSEILTRQGWPGVPAYPYLLWFWTRIAGTGEIAMRMLSVLAMLAAVALLYLAARKMFERDIAIIAAIIFTLHPFIASEAIDVRPYAFAALAITASILALVHLRTNDSNWLPGLLGLAAAITIYFQFLFIVLVPALAICVFVIKPGRQKIAWRQFSIALAVFAVAFVPVIPGLRYMFHTSGIHVFADPPQWAQLRQTLARKVPVLLLVVTLIVAAFTRRLDLRKPSQTWRTIVCASLGLIPILTLYGVSVGTSIRIFVPRYEIVSIPGIALCWALVVSQIRSRALRLSFCIALVGIAAFQEFRSPMARVHNYSWKYALDTAEKNASVDGAPVVICSDLPESNYLPMPVGAAIKDSAIFSPLTYYHLTVPVVPLPRALNDNAKQRILQFLGQVTPRHQRFLAVAYLASGETLDWIADKTDDIYDGREVGTFDGVTVMEFDPHIPANTLQPKASTGVGQ
jgi:uncharacterized membrane protein